MKEFKNVYVDENNTWWRQIRINGTEFMIAHGDYIKGGVSGLIGEEQRLQSILPDQGKPFNVLCLGHFHNHMEIETPRGKILVNGSFVGGDVHSLHQLKTKSRPTQTILGVHPVHGVTWKYTLDMDYAGRMNDQAKS